MKKRVLSLTLAVLMLLSLVPVSVIAEGETSGTYTSDSGASYTLENGTLTVSGTGECWGIPSYFDKSAVTKVVIEEGITGITWEAFEGNKYITSISVPDSVTYIGNHAFMNCSNLADVSFGNGITELGYGTLHGTAYFNDESNWEDGLLYLGGWEVCSDAYTAPESCVIKEGTKGIAPFSFNCTNRVRSIYIPASVKTIGLAAFQRSALNHVYYGGTEEQWAAIDIDNNNYGIDRSMLHFSSAIHAPDCISVVTAPTCTEQGYTAHFCSCGAVKVDSYVDALGHDFKDGVCIHCAGTNNSYTDDNGVIYTLNNGTLTVSGEGECGNDWKDYFDVAAVEEIVIAGSVTTIGEAAFSQCDSLASVTIGNSVTSIGYAAFYRCGSLASVTIGNSVTSIGYAAFSDTAYYNNESDWENNVLYIDGCLIKAKSDLSGDYSIKDGTRLIADYAFYQCDSLTSVSIPDSVTSIGDRAFYWCDSLASVTIGNSVTSIGYSVFDGTACYSDSSNWDDSVLYISNCLIEVNDYKSGDCNIKDGTRVIATEAFFGCSSLSSINIPDSVTNIDCRSFNGCSFSEINVSAGNSSYSSIDGVLYNKAQTELVRYPTAKSGSFSIPDGVTSIDDHAFRGQTLLTSIAIPNSMINIGESAFVLCNSLADVYYDGSQEQWNAISIGDGNDCLTNATIYYNGATHTHSYTDIVTAPTCTAQGYTTHTCDCGEAYVDSYVDKLDHSYTDKLIAPTCTDRGYTLHTCDCGAFKASSFVDALGHSYKDGVCAVCGEADPDYQPPHTHSYTDTVTAPTCTAQGYTTHTCDCGEYYVDSYVGALGHDYQKGTCTRCDAKDPNYKELLPGDINGDGKVNILDLIRLKKYLAGANVELVGSADVNGDGKVNILDLIRLKKYLAGANVELVGSAAQVH